MKQNLTRNLFTVLEGERFPSDSAVEIVERKGLGHPDTLADGLAEVISIAYSRYTLQEFGAILHHQVDKLVIRGGEWYTDFGAAEFVAPIKVIVNGRFSLAFGGQPIPVREIVEKEVSSRLRQIFPSIDPSREIAFVHTYNDVSSTKCWYRPRNLDDLPDRHARWANDTSVVVAYWPLTLTERLAILCENFFYTGPFKPRYRPIGQDIKVMILRHGARLRVTLCLPFISVYTPDRDCYEEQQLIIHRELKSMLQTQIPSDHSLEVFINTQDNNAFRDHPYLTPFGSCIGIGEEGVVGRGNNLLGVIPSYRPYSMEAPYGKNPTYHTGRVFGVLGPRIAKSIHELTQQMTAVSILTLNGTGLTPPFAMNIHLDGHFEQPILEREVTQLLDSHDYLGEILDGGLVPRSWGHFDARVPQ